jgi:hypothetical protein
MNTTPNMTITERNNQLYELRNKLSWAKLEVMSIESEIQRINQEYKDQQPLNDSEGNLFEQMFGDQVMMSTLDTPLAEEYYGG